MANTTGKKFGGRVKGTPNKDTRIIRDKINALLDGIDILDLYNEQETAKDKRDMIIGLMEFSIPKLQRTTVDGDSNNPLQIIWNEQRTYDTDSQTDPGT